MSTPRSQHEFEQGVERALEKLLPFIEKMINKHDIFPLCIMNALGMALIHLVAHSCSSKATLDHVIGQLAKMGDEIYDHVRTCQLVDAELREEVTKSSPSPKTEESPDIKAKEVELLEKLFKLGDHES